MGPKGKNSKSASKKEAVNPKNKIEQSIDSGDDSYESFDSEDLDNYHIPNLEKWYNRRHEHNYARQTAIMSGKPFEAKMPVPNSTELTVLLSEIRGAFDDDMPPYLFDPYYSMLLKFAGGYGLLDPLDPYLHDVPNNFSSGITLKNLPPKQLEESKNIAIQGHGLVITYARLAAWAKAQSAKWIQNGGQPSEISYDDINRSSSNFFIEVDNHFILHVEARDFDSVPEADDDATLEEATVLVGVMAEALLRSPLNVGIYTLFSSTNVGFDTKPFEFHLGVAVDIMTKMAKIYEAAKASNTLPPFSTIQRKYFPAPVDLLLTTAIKSFVVVISKQIEIFFTSQLLEVSMRFLTGAVSADKRIAMALDVPAMTIILRAALQRAQHATLVTYPVINSQLIEGESAWHYTLEVFSRAQECLYNPNSNDEPGIRPKGLKETPEAAHMRQLILAIRPTVIKAITDKINPMVCYEAMQTICEVFPSWNLHDDVPLSILSSSCFSTLSQIIIKQPFYNSAEVDPVEAKKFHYGHLAYNKAGDSKVEVKTPVDFSWLMKKTFCALIHRMSSRGIELISNHSRVVALGEVGRKLLKRDVVPLLLECEGEVDGGEDDYITICLAKLLNTMTRSKDCRLILLNEDRSDHRSHDVNKPRAGIQLIQKLLTHKNWEIVSYALITTVHLLWDPEWTELIVAMEPNIELIAVRWAIVSINHIISTANQNRELAETFMILVSAAKDILAKNKKHPKEFSKYLNMQRERTAVMKGMGDGGYLPDREATNPGLQVLARCILVLAHLPMFAMPRLKERRIDYCITELMFAISTIPEPAEVGTYSFNYINQLLANNALVPSCLPDPQRLVTDCLSHVLTISDFPIDEKLKIWYQTIGQYFAQKPEWASYLATTRSLFAKEHGVRMGIALDNVIVQLKKIEIEVCKNPKPSVNHELQQLRRCGNSESCSKVELRASEFALCGGCKKTAYCGRDCQKAHWKSHKKNCGDRAEK